MAMLHEGNILKRLNLEMNVRICLIKFMSIFIFDHDTIIKIVKRSANNESTF